MQEQRSHDVFISYAREDGYAFATQLRERLEQDFTIWQDVISITPGKPWWPQIEKAIENVTTLVLIVTPSALTSSIVRDEWAFARRKGTQIIPVVFDSSLFVRTPRWILKVDILNLKEEDANFAQSWERFIKALRNPQPSPPVVFMPQAHMLADTFVDREELHRNILEQLLKPTGDPIRNTLTLVGAPGFGKTSLATAICHDPEIVEGYSDGILWATIGEEGRGILTKLNSMVSILTGKPYEFQHLEDASHALHAALEKRECLMVLDDVWDEAHIRWFINQNDQITRLITTRSSRIASALRATNINILGMSEAEAVQVLVNWLPEVRQPHIDSQEFAGLKALSKRLGYWPLLLNLAAGELRYELDRGHSLLEGLNWCQEGLDEQGLRTFDADNPLERNQALSASLNASLRCYEPAEKLRLFELSIFRVDEVVPQEVVIKLWQAQDLSLSTHSAKRLLRQLAGHFFQMRVEEDSGPEVIRVHDAIHEYLSYQLNVESLQETHKSLLRSYNAEGIPWHSIPDDGYLYDHLVYHLQRAARDADIETLFANDSWMRARFVQDGYIYSGYLDDLMIAWTELAHRRILAGSQVDVLWSELAKYARYLIIRTSVNSLATNFIPELIGQAVKSDYWTLEQALARAVNVSDLVQRVSIYAALLELDKLQVDRRSSVKKLALDVALALPHIDRSGLGDSSPCAEALRELAIYLDQHELSYVLDTIITSDGWVTDSWALQVLAEYLRGDLVERALEVVVLHRHEFEEYHFPQIIGSLAGELEGKRKLEIIKSTLESILEIEVDWTRGQGLCALAKHLDGDLFGHALSAALALKNEEVHYLAVCMLANRLESAKKEALYIQLFNSALGIPNEWLRADAFSQLAPHLPTELLTKVFDLVLGFESESARIKAFEGMIESLDHDLTGRLLDYSLNLEDVEDRSHLLAALLNRLPEETKQLVLEEMLSDTLMLGNSWRDMQVKGIVAKNLDHSLLKRALDASLEIRDEPARALVLASLAQYASENPKKHALDRARKIAISSKSDWDQVKILSLLAPYFAGDEKQRITSLALDAALALPVWLEPEDWPQAEAIAILADHLEGNVLERALDAVLTMDSEWAATEFIEWFRAEGIEKLANRLTQSQLARSLKAVLTFHDESARAKALGALVGRVEGNQKASIAKYALEATLSIPDEANRAELMGGLAGHLERELLTIAFNAILLLKDDWARANGIQALAECLDGHLLDQAVNAGLALAKVNVDAGVMALCNLIGKLDGDRRQQIVSSLFEGVLASNLHEMEQANAIARLYQYLDTNQKQLALPLILNIAFKNSITRIWIEPLVLDLAHNLDRTQIIQAIDRALAIDKHKEQREVIAGLLRYTDDILRVRTLASLMLSLQSADRETALLTLSDEHLFSSSSIPTEVADSILNSILDICWNWEWQ